MSPRIAALGADFLVVVHFGFVLFVGLGALLVWRHPRLAALHLPCALYGAAIELFGWICPLTPLEQRLRRIAGDGGYAGGFIEHYIGGLLYPANWDRIHIWLGLLVIAFNAAIYVAILRRRRGGPADPEASSDQASSGGG